MSYIQPATSFPGGKALKHANQAYRPQQRTVVHANPLDFTDNAMVSGGLRDVWNTLKKCDGADEGSKKQDGATQDREVARPMLTGLETDGATT